MAWRSAGARSCLGRRWPDSMMLRRCEPQLWFIWNQDGYIISHFVDWYFVYTSARAQGHKTIDWITKLSDIKLGQQFYTRKVWHFNCCNNMMSLDEKWMNMTTEKTKGGPGKYRIQNGEINGGVPLSSVMGPLLCLVFINGHYCDLIMTAIASQITSLTIV